MSAEPLPCCDQVNHACDRFRVFGRWIPNPLRDLVVGENPGGAESEYFYDWDERRQGGAEGLVESGDPDGIPRWPRRQPCG